MGERAIIEKGMETLEHIGQGESTTFVLPQELTSLLGRYGRQLTDSDVQESAGLDSLDFDAETRELIGLDDIEEILGQIDEAAEMNVEELEQEAQAIKEGADPDIKSADEVVAEADAQDKSDIKDPDDVVAEADGESGTTNADGTGDADGTEERETEKEV
jgi:hypothetical protein